MAKRKHILLLMVFFCRLATADKLSSLPGGLLFPAFSSAGLVNAAALSLDWRQEAKVLYSPPLSQDDSHSYLVSAAYSNRMLGINLGFSGSYQDGSVYDSVFSGLSLRISRLSVGVSFRKAIIESTSPVETDVSSILTLSPTFRVGAIAYHLGDESQIGAGVGLGRLGKQTLSADILFPAKPKGKGIIDQYAANLTLTTYQESFAYSLGMKFSRQQDGFSNDNQIAGIAGTTFPISKSVNFTGLYRSNPHTVTVGFVWLWTPPADKYIQTSKEENWNTIWNKSR
jgi:hypothetical protein